MKQAFQVIWPSTDDEPVVRQFRRLIQGQPEPPCENCILNAECARGWVCQDFVDYVHDRPFNKSNFHPNRRPTRAAYEKLYATED